MPFWGYEWRKKAENHITGLKTVYSLAQPSVYRAVPHVHTVPPSHTAVSSGCRERFLCIGPLGKAGLPSVKAGVENGIIVADSEKEAYTALPPPCAGFQNPFLFLCMVSHVATIVFSTTRYFQFDILYPIRCC